MNATEIIPVPDVSDADVAWSSIKYLPRWDTLPEDYRRGWSRKDHPFCDAIEGWFFNGAKRDGKRLVIGARTFRPKDGIDGEKALRVIKSCMGSFEPKHEHKIAGCGYLLSQWFDLE